MTDPRKAAIPPGEGFIKGRDWTVGEAFRYCGELTETRYSRIPFNPRFLPREIRAHWQNISAFCLFADDFSNAPGYLDNLRPFFIENWESQLLQCMWRKPENPVFIALRETITRFGLPVERLQDLLTGHKFSLAGRRYSDLDDLQENFLRSSRTLGRLALDMLGNTNTETETLSDSFCSGIRMAHLWGDLPRDLERGRIYIPEKNRQKYGYTDEDLLAGRFNSGFRSLMSGLVAETRDLLWKGRPLCDEVDPRIRFEITRIWNGGMRILDRIEAAGFNVFHLNTDLTFREHLMIFLRAALPPLNPKGGQRSHPGKEKT